MLLAALCGAAAGAALGLLMAPEKGKDTRVLLANGAKDIAGRLKQKVEEGLTEISRARTSSNSEASPSLPGRDRGTL